jgi:hypothetical protein
VFHSLSPTLIHDTERGIEYALRPYRGEQDDPLLFSNWCNQIRKQSPFNTFTPEEFSQHRFIIHSLIDRCGVTLACRPDDEGFVYGWICGADPVLHFIYVRNTFRCLGIGSTLMRLAFPGFKERTIYYTHPTKAMRHFAPRWNAKFNPYLCWVPPGRADLGRGHTSTATDQNQNGTSRRWQPGPAGHPPLKEGLPLSNPGSAGG